MLTGHLLICIHKNRFNQCKILIFSEMQKNTTIRIFLAIFATILALTDHYFSLDVPNYVFLVIAGLIFGIGRLPLDTED
jgi:hypothetical protein